VAKGKFNWPENLTDAEALDRLRSVAFAACEGTQDLANDRHYKALRTALMKHPSIGAIVPSAIKSSNTLHYLVGHLKQVGDYKARRAYVGALLEPLISAAKRSNPDAFAAHPIRSEDWTGRRSASRQAEVVKALAPIAMSAIDRLIEDQERILDNGGPVDADQREAIERLRELHTGLGELIRLAEAELPLAEQFDRLADVKERTLRSLSNNLKLDATALPVSASALGVAIAVIGAVELFTGSHVASVALGTMAGAVHGQARANDRKEGVATARRIVSSKKTMS
jgi:hypothetical protein